jgi:hypothetical protein
MGEILGLGMTHYPGLAARDEDMTGILRQVLADPGLPERDRDPANWPEALRREYGTDQGKAAAERHRAALVANFRRARQTLDDFAPDVVVIWGDDQYENFKEDIIPAFCILAYDDVEVQPWKRRSRAGFASNVWSEDAETTFRIPIRRDLGKYLARGLLAREIDVAYAYQPLHHDGIGHAFVNTVLFLNYDRTGFPYPVIPFQVNCYGSRVIAQRGYRSSLASPLAEADLDPPSPSPKRCLEVGAATARVFLESPWRVALIASSSWSHAFLTDKHHQLYPDVAADRKLYDALRIGNYDAWRSVPLSAIEESGHQELLNWFCLVGAMEALGRTPDVCEYVESWAMNSSKCFAIFGPRPAVGRVGVERTEAGAVLR